LAEGEQADRLTSEHQARGVIERLGHPEPFVAEGIALGERAQLGMTYDEADTGAHGGRDEVTEALAAPPRRTP
jgi:hypothetical protein